MSNKLPFLFYNNSKKELNNLQKLLKINKTSIIFNTGYSLLKEHNLILYLVISKNKIQSLIINLNKCKKLYQKPNNRF